MGHFEGLAVASGVDFGSMRIGELLAIADQGRTPLVRFDGAPGTAAMRARTTVDLHADHLGKSVVLLFEEGDANRPVIVGVLRENASASPHHAKDEVQVDADGDHLTVTARRRLVLRCGKASITLTAAGKVLIDGAHVLSRSSGYNRIKGAAVDIN